MWHLGLKLAHNHDWRRGGVFNTPHIAQVNHLLKRWYKRVEISRRPVSPRHRDTLITWASNKTDRFGQACRLYRCGIAEQHMTCTVGAAQARMRTSLSAPTSHHHYPWRCGDSDVRVRSGRSEVRGCVRNSSLSCCLIVVNSACPRSIRA